MLNCANHLPFIFLLYARRPEGRALLGQTKDIRAIQISPNGRLSATLREPIRANPRHQARVCGASAMWVRRAA